MSKFNGYFDSKNNDRMYNAGEISRLFDGLIIDGIFKNYLNGLEVKLVEVPEERPTNMGIYVDTGRCWFNHIWLLNDDKFYFTIENNTGTVNRIDAIVIDIDLTDDIREASFKLINQSTQNNYPILVRETNHMQYPLAYIIVAPNTVKLTTNNIVDRRGKITIDHGTQGIEYGTPFALTTLGTASLKTNIEGMNMIGFQFESSESLVAENMEPNLFYGVAEVRDED